MALLHGSEKDYYFKIILFLLLAMFGFLYSSTSFTRTINRDYRASDYQSSISNAKQQVREREREVLRAEQGLSQYSNSRYPYPNPYSNWLQSRSALDAAKRDLQDARQNLDSLERQRNSDRFEQQIQRQRDIQRSNQNTVDPFHRVYHGN